ncbi:MAG: 4-alpha-glucanotransferase [Acidobacteria bacterium]|nr:MAG: 4-alpha-glucanotransferase [Acidobacteriota bacterium]PYY09444.1 MAG: 4-alpha-glucanotransferase [Acidobacteriota bacterium]
MLDESPKSATGYLALVDGTIYASPTEAPIAGGVVLIQDEKIAAVARRTQVQVPSTAQVLDCSGGTITAGFWNNHVHFFERKWANAAEIPAAELSRQIQDMVTRYGFTSVFDLSSMWENTRRLRERIELGELPGPTIRTTGEGLIPPGAVPSEAVLGVLGVMNFPAPEIADASQATAAARKLLEKGVDGIKLFASSPRSTPLPESAIRAAVYEAHKAGKPVFVHPNSGADVLTAVRAGVDIVAHTTPYSGDWDRSILTTMQERKVALIPTLKIWLEFMRHDRMSAQEKAAKAETGQLRAWVDAGGTVLFGTDVSYINYDPSDEYALMAEAGMSFRQILASLTTAPAERFGDSKRGRIAPGLQADLVVLKGDPARNIRALASVQQTVRAGRIIYRASD